jgi:hypothetical protein
VLQLSGTADWQGREMESIAMRGEPFQGVELLLSGWKRKPADLGED